MRALHVGLDDDGQVLDFAFSHVREHIFQLGCLLLGQLGVAEFAAAVSGNFTGAALIGQHHKFVTCLRHFGQALNLYRDRRARLLHGLAVFIEHGAYTPPGLPCQHHIASSQRTRLHQNRCQRAASFIQTRFNHQPFGSRIYWGFELQHFGLQQHLLKQVINTLASFGRDRDKG